MSQNEFKHDINKQRDLCFFKNYIFKIYFPHKYNLHCNL